jgi:hypothetical protein
MPHPNLNGISDERNEETQEESLEKPSIKSKQNEMGKLFILIISILLYSCSAQYHLNKAIKKGYKFAKTQATQFDNNNVG